MIDVIEADAPEVFVPGTKIPNVEGYLHELALDCEEAAADDPRMRGLLLALLTRAPQSIIGLSCKRKRLAA